MAIWYEVVPDDKEIDTFIKGNWEFHDFRIERIEYIPSKGMAEVFLKYDTNREGRLLKFFEVSGIGINTQRDYRESFIFGCSTIRLEDETLIWLDDDDWGAEEKNHLDEVKTYATWIQSKRIVWAVTDGDGLPVEMPESMKHQVWSIFGKVEQHDFDFKEYEEV